MLGAVRRDGLMVLIAAGLLAALMLGTALATIIFEVRKARSAKEDRSPRRRP